MSDFYCPKCGAKLTARFCANCGFDAATLNQNQPEPAQIPIQQSVQQIPQQPIQQPVQQVSQQPVQQPIQQMPQQPSQQYAQQMPQGSAYQPAQPAAQQPEQGAYYSYAAEAVEKDQARRYGKKKSKAPIIAIIAAVIVLAGGFGIFKFLTRTIYHTVTFDPNGGSVVSGELSQQVEDGQSAAAPVVEQDGFFFKGWDGTYESVTEDETVKAQWAEGYTITFDPGDGEITSGEAEQFVEAGSSVTAPTASLDGYNFTGWDPAVGTANADATYTALWEKKEMNAEELYDYAKLSVVEIHVYDQYGEYFAQGSGFFIDGDGTIVTNYHVIEDATAADIILADDAQTTYSATEVLAWDADLDLAIIKCDCTDSVPLTISESGVTTGETVYTLGSSLGFTGTISDGIVSTASRDVDGVDCIQISAPISHGNSGGPLLNVYGEVIGVNSMSYSEGQNLNFAININELENLDDSNPLTMEEFYDETGTGSDYMEDAGAEVFDTADWSENERNNTMEDADLLPDGESIAGYVDPDDWDYFGFELEEDDTISIDLVPYYKEDAEYLRGIIVDEDQNILEVLEFISTSSADYQTITTDLDAGTYYFYVDIDPDQEYPYETGAFYMIYFNVGENAGGSVGTPVYPEDDDGAEFFDEADIAETEPDNDMAHAVAVEENEIAAGYCDPDDEDYFTFTLDSDAILIMVVVPYYDVDADYMQVELLDKNGNVICELETVTDDDGDTGLGTMEVLDAGTYYLKVSVISGYTYTNGPFYLLSISE